MIKIEVKHVNSEKWYEVYNGKGKGAAWDAFIRAESDTHVDHVRIFIDDVQVFNLEWTVEHATL